MHALCRRLEHSLGVGHLAYTLADSIYKMQREELDISRSDVKCAEIAGAGLSKAECQSCMQKCVPKKRAVLCQLHGTDIAQTARPKET
jgi:hypothetical protein